MLNVSLSSCRRYRPPERLVASVSLQRSVLPSLLNSEFGPLGLRFSRSPMRSLSFQPDDLLTILWMALSIGSMHFVSSVHAIQATGL